MKRLSWFVFFSVFTLSCLDQPDCYQLNNNEMVISFRIIGGGNDTYLSSGITATGTDRIFIKDTAASSVALPLNPYEKQIRYTFPGIFGVGLTAVKNLDLTYSSRVQFVSEDCGERFVFSNIAVDTTNADDFDDYRIVNAVPTNPKSLNLELYRCPVTDLLYLDFVGDLPIEKIQIGTGPELTVTEETLSSVLLPLDTAASSSSYTFKYRDGESDNLTVNYVRTTRAISPKCGPQVFIGQLAYDTVRTTFTKITVLKDSIYDLPQFNFELTR